MAKKEVLKVEHVGMKFNLSQEKVDDLKDYVIKLLKHQISYNEFWALKDINFTLRHRRNGDIISPLGLKGSQTLAKYLNEKKVPNHEKNSVILLCKGNEVMWAAGLGLNENQLI